MKDIYTAKNQVSEWVSDRGELSAETATESRTWYLPSETVENLREYTLTRYGSSQHLGAFCTRAMRNWESESASRTHRTWERLKHDYTHEQDLTGLTYRQVTDYTETEKEEKTALGFSAPFPVLVEFTEGVPKDEYGSKLANAVEAELLKRAQIDQMQQAVRRGEAFKDETKDMSDENTSPTVEVNGGVDDFANVRIDTHAVEIDEPQLWSVAENGSFDWRERRGLLAAFARGQDKTTKERMYKLDAGAFDVDKTRSQRKDYRAILEQASKEAEPLNVAPAKVWMDALDSNNLAQTLGLTHRKNPQKFETDSLELLPLQVELYNSEKTDEDTLIDNMEAFLWDYGVELIQTEWRNPDTVRQVYDGKHLKDTIKKLVAGIDTLNDLDGGRLSIPTHSKDNLETLRADLKRKAASIQTTGGTIEEAYEHFTSRGTEPKSDEWNQQH